MNIRFLYSKGCEHSETAYSRLKETVSALVPGTIIEKVEIRSEESARKEHFYGSPSIHINGVDLEHNHAQGYSNSCRFYGQEGAPPKWLIEAGILRRLEPKGLLFLCVANSARSQIGEGIARHIAPVTVKVQSAGSKPTRVRKEAIRVLSEWGIDASKHRSKNVSLISPATVDTVITLCGEEECPVFLGQAYRLHWELPDPAAVNTDQEARLNAFRQIRDELKKRISVIFADQVRTSEAAENGA